MMYQTLTISKHEVVVDRDWLEEIANLLKELGDKEKAKEVKQVAYPEDGDE